MDKTRPTRRASTWVDTLRTQPILFLALLLAFGVMVLLFVLVVLLVVNPFGRGTAALPLRPTVPVQLTTATPIPTPTTVSSGTGPSIAVLPVAGEPGILINVTGKDWPPNDTVSIRIDDPTGSQGLQPLFANALVANNGTFVASLILPAGSAWVNLNTILVTVQATTGGARVSAEFSLLNASGPLLPSPAPIITSSPPPIGTPLPGGPFPLPTTQYVSSPGEWAAEYYANPDLVGAPVLVRNEVSIDFDWGYGSPASIVPVDGFSARWIRTYELEPGLYRFHILADDGVRFWVNNDMLTDQWYPSAPREIQVDYPIRFGGLQGIRIEYADFGGNATARFWWEKLAVPLPPPDGGIPPYQEWRGQYWPNVDLFGSPLLVRSDPNLSFDWGSGSAGPGLPADNFSARWLRLVDFEPSSYRFYLTVDDGARLWIDNQLIIDEWRDGSLREVTRDYALSGGRHEIRVEYYDRTGNATIRLRWDRTPNAATPTIPASFPDWKGEYWTNANLSGAPNLLRNDPVIDFNWGSGSPDLSIPADNFSARWSRSVYFSNGIYRFTVQANDGVRLYIDGTLVLNEWADTFDVRTSTLDLSLTGQHSLVVEYYERTGTASIRLRWEQVTATATPTTPAPDAAVPLTAAKIDLSSRTGVPVALINVLSLTPMEWPTSSLGCPLVGPGLEVITPGYLIFLQAAGSTYEYHTDQGTNVILCNLSATPTPTGTPIPTLSPTPLPTATSTSTTVPTPSPTLITPTLPVITLTLEVTVTGTPGTPSP